MHNKKFKDLESRINILLASILLNGSIRKVWDKKSHTTKFIPNPEVKQLCDLLDSSDCSTQNISRSKA
jgi:hypothetical protein